MSPKKLDWFPSFTNFDKIPYGCKVLYERLPDIFPQAEIIPVERRCYEVIKDSAMYQTNYVIINNSFGGDKLDMEYLLDFAHSGNQIFLSSEIQAIYSWLLDSLGLQTDYFFSNELPTQGNSTLSCHLNPTFFPSDTGFTLKSPPLNYYFETGSLDSIPGASVLGTIDQEKPNFIHIPLGEGGIFIHGFPYAFTNYNVLDHIGHTYAERCLSVLPVQNTLWDNYYKNGKLQGQSSPLRVLLTSRSLRTAWYLFLIALILYFVFHSRRKQRAIPIAKPPKNASKEFVQIIGNLHFNKKNYHGIIRKKINYFNDFVFKKYRIRLTRYDENEAAILSNKSDNSQEEVLELLELVNKLKHLSSPTSDQLIFLSKKLNAFYKYN